MPPHDKALGTDLTPADQRQVLSAYPYRMTQEAIKRWPEAAQTMRQGGYALSIITDAQWLASTQFKVDRRGRLSTASVECEHDAYKFRTKIEEN